MRENKKLLCSLLLHSVAFNPQRYTFEGPNLPDTRRDVHFQRYSTRPINQHQTNIIPLKNSFPLAHKICHGVAFLGQQSTGRHRVHDRHQRRPNFHFAHLFRQIRIIYAAQKSTKIQATSCRPPLDFLSTRVLLRPARALLPFLLR